MSEKARRWKRRGPIWAAVIGLLLVGLVVLAMGWGLWTRTKLDRLIAAAHEAGQPVSLVELATWYPEAPLGEDAAPVYERAFANVVNPDDAQQEALPLEGNAKLPARYEPLSEEMLSACERYLADNKSSMDLLYEAIEKPYCQFPVDYTPGVNMLMPHLAHLRQASRRLGIDAMVAAERGESDRAARAVVAGLAAGNALRGDPMLIAQLVRVAVDGITVSGLERVLSRTSLPDQELARLDWALAACEDPGLQARAMIGERCFGMDAGSWAAASGSGSGSLWGTSVPNPAYLVYRMLGFEARDRLSYFVMMTALIDASSLPYEERIEAVKRVAADVKALPDTRVQTKMVFDALERCTLTFLRDAAVLRTARGGVAVERYRLAQGELPMGLEALASGQFGVLPVDPYTGEPLRYKRLERGYVVYSVGHNLTDEGGSDEKVDGGPADVTFFVER